jgi:GT2 family glycosyltransferase
MLAKISVLVVNLNNLEYTKQCIEDLLLQDVKFNLTIVDQNSSEVGTKKYINQFFRKVAFDFEINLSLKDITENKYNRPLNHIWNDFVFDSSTEYLCLLNNDVRIPPNFLSSSIAVLEKEPLVGFVNHVTNNSNYSQWSDTLEYKIMEQPYRQGWDMTFRNYRYNKIPEELKFFYGDDYLYSKLYSSNYKGAYILNSPMLHFESSTTTEKGGARDCTPDGIVYHSLELEHKNLKFNEELSKWKPQFINITKK